MIPSSHLILCRPLLLLPPIPPSIRVFSNESTLLMRWPKYWSLASVLPKKSQGWSPSEWTGCISLQSKRLSRVFSNTTTQKHQFFGTQPSSHAVKSRFWVYLPCFQLCHLFTHTGLHDWLNVLYDLDDVLGLGKHWWITQHSILQKSRSNKWGGEAD